MKKQYKKPSLKTIKIDKQISLVMMTSEGTPPGGPFGSNLKMRHLNSSEPYKS